MRLAMTNPGLDQSGIVTIDSSIIPITMFSQTRTVNSVECEPKAGRDVLPLLYGVPRSKRKTSHTGETYVPSDEKETDAVERIINLVTTYSFESDLLLADRDFYNEYVIRQSQEIVATVVPLQNKGYYLK